MRGGDGGVEKGTLFDACVWENEGTLAERIAGGSRELMK